MLGCQVGMRRVVFDAGGVPCRQPIGELVAQHVGGMTLDSADGPDVPLVPFIKCTRVKVDEQHVHVLEPVLSAMIATWDEHEVVGGPKRTGYTADSRFEYLPASAILSTD